MALTVRRLTQNGDLGLTLIAGREGADQVIEWAHPIELADPTPWLSGGELVMTTGLRIGDTDTEQFAYVSRLVRAGSVALAFDTGTTFDQVPSGVRSAGDALGLPILAVPPSTPFIAITRAVADELTADQIRRVQSLVDQQEKLARATLRGGIPALVTALGRAFSSPIAMVDADGRILAVHGPNSASTVDHACLVAAARRGATRHQRSATKVFAGENGGHCTVQTISTPHGMNAYLAVASDGPLSPLDRLLVTHAVSLISIELGKPAKVVDAENRLRVAVTQALLNHGSQFDISLLRYFGFDPDAPVVALALTDVGPLIHAEQQTNTVIAGLAIPYLMCTTADMLIVIVPEAHSTPLAPALQERSSAQLQRAVGLGAGLPTSVDTAAISVRQAAAAARVARRTPGRVAEFGAHGVFSLLIGGQTAEELELLAQSTLGALDTQDAKQGSAIGLVDTLSAFLSANGHTETAAGELGIHRHTMRNRIHKIAELTGRDLDSAHDRAELWIALQARETARNLGETARAND